MSPAKQILNVVESMPSCGVAANALICVLAAIVVANSKNRSDAMAGSMLVTDAFDAAMDSCLDKRFGR